VKRIGGGRAQRKRGEKAREQKKSKCHMGQEVVGEK
jgi:hypothetical protein